MADYKITLADGTEFEAKHAHECLGMALGYQHDRENESEIENRVQAVCEKLADDIHRDMMNRTPRY